MASLARAEARRNNHLEASQAPLHNDAGSPNTADVDIFSLSTLQAAYFRLQAQNRAAESNRATLTNQYAQLQARSATIEAERDQLRSDNAALGISLANQHLIRHNSKAAVINDLAVRSRLSSEVTGRLLQNEEFVRKWLSGQSRIG